MPTASTQPATAGPLEDRISGEGSPAFSARSYAEPGARADRRVGASCGSAHHAVGDRKKSLGSLELTAKQKRVVMQMVAQEYPITKIAEVLEMARSTYYHRRVQTDEQELRQAIAAVAGEWPRYGYRRITKQLQRQGWTLNHKRVERLMRELGLQAQRKPKRRIPTTDSSHPFPRYPNVVAHLEMVRPDQVWVCDITSIRLLEEFVYLAVLMDVFTRGIRGWRLGRSLDQSLTLRALEQALAQHTPEIHHSDQGVQYAATAYTDRLRAVGVQISMAEVGAAWQNGYAERLMRTIKEEEVDLSDYENYADAVRQVGRFLDEVYMLQQHSFFLGVSYTCRI
jgi:putative transposase